MVLELQSLSISEQNENKAIDYKKDQNNNNNNQNNQQSLVTHHNPFNNPNPMQSNNHNYNGNQRKFHSRYFNNRKDRPMTNNRNTGPAQGQGNFRHYNSNNHNYNEYGKNKKSGNNFNRDRNNQHQQQSTSNPRNNSPSQTAVNEQFNRTSPNSAKALEADVTPPTTFNNRNYQPQQTPTVPYFVGGEGCDYNQNPGGYYIFSQPTTPQAQQFGLYLTAPVPGPPTQLSTPTPTNPNGPNGPPFSAFLGHPGPVIGAAVAPGPVQQPYFASSSEIANPYGAEPPFDSVSGYPPYMSYPCPFFYSPTTNPNATGNPPPHGVSFNF